MALRWFLLGCAVWGTLAAETPGLQNFATPQQGEVVDAPPAPPVPTRVIDKHAKGMPYFHFYEGELRCFYEELNPTVHVLSHYKCPHLDHQYRAKELGVSPEVLEKIGIEVYVNDPEGYPVWLLQHHQVLSAPEGSFSFDSTTAGEYEICLRTNTSHWHQNEKLKFHLQVDVGADAVEYFEATPKGPLDELHSQAKELKAKMAEIIQDQAYLRVRDARFRQTSESTYTRVWAFALLQIFLLCATAYWQLTSFKHFLLAKKVV